MAFVINNRYDFSLYANSILGHSYRGAKLASILDYQTALKFGNIELLHRQVFPYLPPGTPSDQTKYTYYVFDLDGTTIILADVWVISNSVTLSSGVDKTIVLRNVSTEQVTIIRDQLLLLGIGFDIL